MVVGGRSATGDLPRQAIRFEGVRFGYPGREHQVFDELDLEIEAGRSLAIVGENGAGKTTLIKLLCRLYDPDGGRITVDGVDLRDLDPASWRRRLAAVFQDFVRFELSAYDNIAYGALANRDDLARVEEVAELAGASHVIDRLPHRWTTPLSRSFTEGTQLSGGEWQRLALARALFAIHSGGEPVQPDLLDGGVDHLQRGGGRALVSHHFSTVRMADLIVVLTGGTITEIGTHGELVAARGTYAELYRLQARAYGR